MFATSFPRSLAVILLGLALATLPSVTYGSHSSLGYHWARTANPFTLKLGDNLTSSDWKSKLAQTSQDWNSPQTFATTSPLVTSVTSVIQSGQWAGATLIEIDNAGSATGPQIAMDTTGNAIAVWEQFDGARYNVWAKRYTAGYTAGSGWGAATLIETNNTGSASGPQIAMDANGNAISVWYQSDGVRYNVWANRYTAGSGWGAATLIETNNAGGTNRPQIAMNASGNAIAMWPQSDGVRDNIWANRYTAGSGWGIATLIETDNAGGASGPRIAINATGNAVAVWAQSDGVRNNVWANRYTAGSGWDAATLIELNNAGYAGGPGHAGGPQIAIDATGNAISVWYQYGDIWANRYTAGSGWGAATLIETNTTKNAISPSIAMDATGNAIVVWEQGDGAPNSIWANRYTAGSGWGAVTRIETDNGTANRPQIVMTATGNAIAVWGQAATGIYNIWANHYSAGSGWGAATLIETDNAGSAYRPQIAMNANGNAVAVWYQFDGTRYNVWANRFVSDSSCAMVAGTAKVCNGNYGNNGWLGLATININGLHITQGSAKMNDTYFSTSTYNNPNMRLHVMCQEVAHTFGLDHQSTNGSSLNTCMDYFSNTGVNATSTLSTRPNLHDFDQLNIIYSHLDSTTTLAAMTALTASAAEPSDDPKNWGHLKSQSGNGRSSIYERYNSDGSETITYVYWTIEAAANCPSCDHRYDR